MCLVNLFKLILVHCTSLRSQRSRNEGRIVFQGTRQEGTWESGWPKASPLELTSAVTVSEGETCSFYLEVTHVFLFLYHPLKVSEASGHTSLRGKCRSAVLSEEMFRVWIFALVSVIPMSVPVVPGGPQIVLWGDLGRWSGFERLIFQCFGAVSETILRAGLIATIARSCDLDTAQWDIPDLKPGLSWNDFCD